MSVVFLSLRIAQNKQPRLLKPCLNSDLYFISKTSGTALLETIVSYIFPVSPRKTEKRSPSASRYLNNKTALLCIFSSILKCSQENQKNSIMNGFKCRSKGVFVTQKASTSNTNVQRCLYPLFQNQCPHFLLSLFSEKYVSPQVRINKMINKHTVDYDTSP